MAKAVNRMSTKQQPIKRKMTSYEKFLMLMVVVAFVCGFFVAKFW